MLKILALICPCLLLAVAIGCSGDSSPAGPAAGSSGEFALQSRYAYRYNDRLIELETSSRFLAVRFRDDADPSDVAWVLSSRHLRVVVPPEANGYRFHVVQARDAFAAARILSRPYYHTEYIGPVFEERCGGENMISAIPGNSIIVRGDITNSEVAAWLEAAGAVVASRRDDTPPRYVYDLPWGDPAALFDLTNRLYDPPSIAYAQPNFLRGIYLASTPSPGTGPPPSAEPADRRPGVSKPAARFRRMVPRVER